MRGGVGLWHLLGLLSELLLLHRLSLVELLLLRYTLTTLLLVELLLLLRDLLHVALVGEALCLSLASRSQPSTGSRGQGRRQDGMRYSEADYVIRIAVAMLT